MEELMPKTEKGKKIYAAMKDTYGSEKKADKVFNASANKGVIKGVHKAKKKRGR